MTWSGIQTSYGFWLAWLAQMDALEGAVCPSSRVCQARLEAYLAYMRALGLADYTVAGRLADVGRALRVMAPEIDTAWIELGASRLHSEAQPAKDLGQIMRPAADLVDLGFTLMQSIGDDGSKGGSYASLRFRDGLMIAFLIHCPLRRRNLAALQLDRHLFKEEGVWRVDIPAGETKTNQAIRCIWPPSLVDQLEAYLAIHREVLLKCGSHDVETDNLWITRQGGGTSAAAVYQAICDRTEAAFGIAINPHAFRHIAATDLATLAPESATAIKDILGHKSMRPSEKCYNRSRTIGAARRMHATFDTHRSGET